MNFIVLQEPVIALIAWFFDINQLYCDTPEEKCIEFSNSTEDRMNSDMYDL